jgi:RNA polymerase sigma factor (sigma-70 family)
VLALRYRAPLRRFLAAMLPDASAADDAVQETLLRLWLLRERYEPTGRFSTYLFQIARNHALNARKRMNGEMRRTVEPSPPADLPEEALLRRERAERVEKAIRALPALYRSVFLLSHREGLRYADISARLSIPVGTVKSRMAEAVRRLRAALSPEERED